ncbi:MAG TPA: hypothetical protein DDX39_02835 [Bacteroidales bacterium]|nr:MAG: hypothetical protein A2W98_03050 [Bacteroidetes bacterium GWF2_33_38]HBF87553.1 hypothetical protein [Bacteroidales bacterium]
MKNYTCKLEEDKFYHIYNRGNNKDKLFYSNANYEYFLRKYDEYLSDFVETYAFCLLPNHFHFLVRIKNVSKLTESMISLKAISSIKEEVILSTEERFRRLFITYSQAINKQQNRHGSLFEKPFRRIEISNTKYLANLVFYIHANPTLHGIDKDFRMYAWSSYHRILISKPSKLQKAEVIEWFSDKENYVAFHSQKIEIEKIKQLLLE